MRIVGVEFKISCSWPSTWSVGLLGCASGQGSNHLLGAGSTKRFSITCYGRSISYLVPIKIRASLVYLSVKFSVVWEKNLTPSSAFLELCPHHSQVCLSALEKGQTSLWCLLKDGLCQIFPWSFRSLIFDFSSSMTFDLFPLDSVDQF